MSLAVFEDVSLSFGKKTIVDELGLRIGTADRIGLIGPNGSGKTSIMRMLAAEQAPDGGQISLRKELRLGYLPQDIALSGGRSLLSFVRDSVPGRAELDDTVARAEAELAEAERDDRAEEEMMAIVERLSELHEQVTHYDMHYTEHEATRILSGLGFQTSDLGRDMGEFSGGWKMRGVLAALLFQQPDLLLLDEPTNHLDMPSVTWFGDFLKQYERAFILICHDREFLNEQVKRIISFEPEGVRLYSGDYESYLRQRAEEEVILENKAKNIAREREQAERFINRFRAQANKARAVQSRVKALEKMEKVETFQKRKVMRFKFPPTGRCSNEPVLVQGLAKSYGDHQVLSGVDLGVRRGEKIGIIGVNGAGKTTLLRIMAGEIEPSAGQVQFGHNVKAGYYAQHHADTLHKESTIFDEVAGEAEDATITQIRTVLGAFLFSDDDVDKKIGVLSGGERARVALAKLLINPGNLLMMDEPTNHLDLASSEALADSLGTYDGTLIFVSHNRSFVHRLATRIWNVADGTVEPYPGTLDEYMDAYRTALAEGSGDGASKRMGGPPTTKPQTTGAPRQAKQASQPEAPRRKRGSRAEEKERKRREAEARRKNGGGDPAKKVRDLESKISRLETAQKERSELLADPEVYADKARSNELIQAFKKAQAELDLLTERWLEAQAALEATQD
ncbi:MAG: ABC-F family ATP-binding cassette domain-containing protein [Myxococcales bacterium]|nr:ABC-F family ATP-binding cassette domain-containing protein [Myxococcales bacterium]